MRPLVIISILNEVVRAVIRGLTTVHTYCATYGGMDLNDLMARY